MLSYRSMTFYLSVSACESQKVEKGGAQVNSKGNRERKSCPFEVQDVLGRDIS